MLKMTKIKLKLITDLDMYIFFDKRYEVEFLTFLVDITQTNNKYLKSYDPKEDILYT